LGRQIGKTFTFLPKVGVLDKDKATGIPPGADRERTLYREVDQSQAVIIRRRTGWPRLAERPGLGKLGEIGCLLAAANLLPLQATPSMASLTWAHWTPPIPHIIEDRAVMESAEPQIAAAQPRFVKLTRGERAIGDDDPSAREEAAAHIARARGRTRPA
jgi:hypothetical protein